MSLRLVLPPLSGLDAKTEVPYLPMAGASVAGAWDKAPPDEIARRWPQTPTHLLLHAEDVALACAPMPPLSGTRLAAAVATAAEPLVLGDLSQVILAYGPRAPDGNMPLAWVDREAFEAAWHKLVDAGLELVGCYPSPFFLPVTEAGGWTLCDGGQNLLVRTGMDTGFLLPCERTADQAGGRADQLLAPRALKALFAREMPPRVQWAGPAPAWWQVPAMVEGLPDIEATQRDTGPLPTWSIKPNSNVSLDARAWRTPLAWLGAAAAAFLIGLNLYAGRLAREGEALRAHMVQRVQSVFPGTGPVTDPLRQVRQLHEARQAALQAERAETFVGLMHTSAQALPWEPGQVRSLAYVSGALTVGLFDGTDGSPSAELPSWAEAAEQAGLQVKPAEPGRWRIQVLRDASAEPSKPETSQ